MANNNEDQEFDEVLKAINRRHWDRIRHEKDPENASDMEREILRQGQEIHELKEKVDRMTATLEQLGGGRTK